MASVSKIAWVSILLIFISLHYVKQISDPSFNDTTRIIK